MPHECNARGKDFITLSRLRLHDCPTGELARLGPLSSLDSFLDSISNALDVNVERRNQERERRGLEAASETLKVNLKVAAKGDTDVVSQMLAYYGRELQEYRQTENDNTYRGMFWAFYESAAEAFDEIAIHEGWPFLTGLIGAYSRESDDRPFVNPVIENTIGRHAVRAQRHGSVRAVSVEALAHLGSFRDLDKGTSWEESFVYGWGIGYPEHSIEEQLQDAVIEELFWVRGMLLHAFYADQYATADLIDALLSDKRIDYGGRHLLAPILFEVGRDSTPEVPRYWDVHDELDNRLEFDETAGSQLRNTTESEGLHRQLEEEWASAGMDL